MKKYIFLIILVAIPAIVHLVGPGYHSMHDDLQAVRILEMEKCFADGQIPCRWSPDLVYGYGQAMYNYYSAFPYYLGGIISFLGIASILSTVKFLFMLALIGSGIGMFILVRDIWGEKAGVLAAVMYMYAPYHALDIIVRGALSESFSLAILPFLLHALYRVIKKGGYWNIAYLALSFAALLTTHNISTLLYAGPVFAWTLYWLYKEKKIKSIGWISIGGVLGFMVAGFFILPVFLEKSLFQSQLFVEGYSFFGAHFVSVRQLFFDRSWGYGPSIFGTNDLISFQIGIVHWVLGIVAGLFALFLIFKKDFSKKPFLAILLLLIAAAATILTHNKSTFLWENISLLAFTQFPWRLLGPVIFFLSFAIGFLAVHKRVNWIVVGGLCALVILLNFSYFEPQYRWYDMVDEDKLTGELFEIQQRAATYDYLPITAEMPPNGFASDRPELLTGVAEISEIDKRSNSFYFTADVREDAYVRIPVIFFPGWEVYVNGSKVPIKIENPIGVIEIDIPVGASTIEGKFVNTPVRTVGNALTVAGVFLLVAGAVAMSRRKH